MTNNTPPRWVEFTYGKLINTIGYIVERTSDQGAEIAIRALPILAPLPNAISMYHISQTQLHFGREQAFALAGALEVVLFGTAEVALKMFDGYERNPRKYKYPFMISLIVSVLVLLLVIAFVYKVEVKALADSNPILALLPLISGASAILLALSRWHARNQEAATVTTAPIAQAENSKPVSKPRKQTQAERTELQAEPQAEPQADPQVKPIEVVLVTDSADTDLSPILVPGLDALDLRILNEVRSGASTPYAIAKRLGIAQTTLKRKDGDGYIGRLPALVSAGHLLNGGTEYRIAGE